MPRGLRPAGGPFPSASPLSSLRACEAEHTSRSLLLFPEQCKKRLLGISLHSSIHHIIHLPQNLKSMGFDLVIVLNHNYNGHI